jgi:hypothetical protein
MMEAHARGFAQRWWQMHAPEAAAAAALVLNACSATQRANHCLAMLLLPLSEGCCLCYAEVRAGLQQLCKKQHAQKAATAHCC